MRDECGGEIHQGRSNERRVKRGKVAALRGYYDKLNVELVKVNII